MRDTAHPQVTQASSATVIEPAQWASSQKEHTRKKCILTEVIAHDHKLSAHERCVGIAILARVNWKHGYAKIGMNKTAERLGFKEDTATKGRDAVVARGYFRYEPRGPNRAGLYWPHLKLPHETGYFDNAAEGDNYPVSNGKLPRLADQTTPLDGVEPCSNHVNNQEGAPPARTPVPVERESFNGKSAPPPGGAPATDDKIQQLLIRQAAQAYGITPASSQAEPLRATIRDAVTFIPAGFVESHIVMSQSFPAFQASIASAKIAVAAPSS